MTFKKVYHTHLNPSGDPLFLVIEGVTCEDCEKGQHDKTPRTTPDAGLQTSTNNVAANSPKRKRKRQLRPLHRLRGKDQLQRRDVGESQCVTGSEVSGSNSNSGSTPSAQSTDLSKSGDSKGDLSAMPVKLKRKRKLKDSSVNSESVSTHSSPNSTSGKPRTKLRKAKDAVEDSI